MIKTYWKKIENIYNSLNLKNDCGDIEIDNIILNKNSNIKSDLTLNYTDNSNENLANILYTFINTQKPKILKKIYKNNKIILNVDENIKLETRTLKYTKAISNLINKNKIFFKKSLGWLPDDKYTENNAKEYIKFSTYGENFIKDFVVKYKNKVVGVIDFHEIVNTEANIGYWLDEKMQGLGIITKSCKKLIEYGFTQFFGNFITLSKISAVLLLWRFITYYMGMIIGGAMFSIEKKVK